VNLLKQLRIGQRIALANGLGLALLVLVSVLAAFSLRGVEKSLHEVTDQRYQAVNLALSMAEVANRQAVHTRNALIFDSLDLRLRELEALKSDRAEGSKMYERLQALLTTAEERAALERMVKLRDVYRGSLDTFDQLLRGEKLDDARLLLMDRISSQQSDYMQSLAAFSQLQEGLMNASVRQADAAVDRSYLALGLGAALALVGGLAAGALVARSITGPLARAVGVAEAVAAGQLGQRIEADGRDETARLLGALRHMNDSLARVVSQVRLSSDSIATGSAQIAAGNADLSVRTESQASSLEETASSMEQLNATVKSSADTARQAAELSEGASAAATRGGEVVGQVVATMNEISESSRRISDIIGTIDGIAFQTNILALNAAVEAARAGEQGRGFAVVAGEVRSLAQRSAAAAREIKTLIQASVEKVENGARLVGAAGDSMGDIVAQVQRVNTLMSEISSATQQQTAGIGQVNLAVSQLDQSTQQNAALVEQSAAAAASLSQQAQSLVQAVGAFRLEAAAH
jgi:methyl-accepting chemotaxis protein